MSQDAITPSDGCFSVLEIFPLLASILRRILHIACIGVLFSALLGLNEVQAQYFRFGKNKVHYEDQDWSYVQSEHFTVYYYDDGAYLADFTARAAEEAFDPVARLFELNLERRISLIVFKNHAEFAVTNAVDLPTYSDYIGGVTELFKNRIAIPFVGDYRDFRRVIHHELVHAVVNEVYYGGSIQSLIQAGQKMRIPPWFSEGLAEYLALGWDTRSDMYMREAVLEDQLPSIKNLSGFYAYRGGQSVWDYIAEQYGQEKIGEILQRLRTARSVEHAIVRSIGLNLDELSERWKRTLREVHFPEVTARESLEEIAKPIITSEHGFYNTSPALSPLGDKIAYVSTTSGLFDVYIADANDGTIEKRLIQGQISRDFESLSVLTPGLTWNPEGTQLAIAVRSGRSDAVAIVDVLTERTRLIHTEEIEQILSLSWSPDGEKIALGATNGIQSDIWILTIEEEAFENLTDDVFSDYEPAWSPDGLSLVFHSDRADRTELKRYTTEETRIFEENFNQLDLYFLALNGRFARRLTTNTTWDDRSARFGADPDRIVFVSDRNGIDNLYEKHLVSGRVRPLTDLDIGVMQVNVAAGTDLAAIVSLRKGIPSIYSLRLPFNRSLPREPLIPNVWAQRVDESEFRQAPALTVAGRSRVDANPFLRDATDGEAYPRGRERLLPRPVIFTSTPDSLIDHFISPGLEALLALSDRDPIDLPVDSFARGITLDFQSLVDHDVTRAEEPYKAFLSPASGPLVDEDGEFIAQPYKLRFSPDIVYGAAGYDALYGVQGVTQLMFSDMLGDHRFLIATNLLLDLRNSDYRLGYYYLPDRVDWSISIFHLSRLLADFAGVDPTYYRYRQYGASIQASYPFDKFHRIDVELGIVGVNQADVTDVTRPSVSRTLLAPRITYTKDSTTPGYLFPVDGSRLAVSLSGAPTSFTDKSIRFGTILFDARTYSSFAKGRYTFATRLSAGTSFGPHQQVFYSSGVQNWLNRNFDDLNGFPIEDVSDFIFATPVMPMRGFDINAANGSNFGLINAEFRFPLVAALLPGPVPLIPFYNIEGQVFADVGNIWGGRSTSGRDANALPGESVGEPRRDEELMVGTGFGIRTLFLGYPVRLDFAWPFDGRRFGDRHTYISVGLDF